MPRASDPSSRRRLACAAGPARGLGHYVEVIRDRRKLILTCVVIVTLVAGMYASSRRAPRKAESHLLVTPVNGESNLIGLGLITELGQPDGRVSTAASLVTTSEVAALVAASVGHTTGARCSGTSRAVPVAQSNVVAITASASTAERAPGDRERLRDRDRQQPHAHAAPPARSDHPDDQGPGRSAPAGPAHRPGLARRTALRRCRRCWRGPTRRSRSSRSRSARARPRWPRTKLSVIAGFLIGLVLGLGGAFALESLDPRVRREETLRRIFRPARARPHPARTPARIAPADAPGRNLAGRPGELPDAACGAGRARPPDGTRSIMVTGSTRSEGKSTVALNLAATMAFSGHKRDPRRGRPAAAVARRRPRPRGRSAANVARPAC